MLLNQSSLISKVNFNSIWFFPKKKKEAINDKVYKLLFKKLQNFNFTLTCNSIFIGAFPKNGYMLKQGWKIHISSNGKNYLAILNIVLDYLKTKNIVFKVVSAEGSMEMLSKQFPREQTGKFITIYPSSKKVFQKTLLELSTLLKKFTGVPILTDKLFCPGSIVSYRYGGFIPIIKFNHEGSPVYCIWHNKEMEEDIRSVGNYKPSWISDKFIQNNGFDKESKDLQLKKLFTEYDIIKSLQFTNFGGVYIGINKKDNRKVIIKEARKFLGGSDLQHSSFSDVTELRYHEFETLKYLSSIEVAPRPKEYVKAQYSDFLIEEYVRGLTLKEFRLENPLYFCCNFDSELEKYLSKVAMIFYDLWRKIKQINDKNVLVNDISPNNIIVNPRDYSVKLIDFESATRKNCNKVPIFVTPGYYSSKKNLKYKTDEFSFITCLIDVLICKVPTLNISKLMIINALKYCSQLSKRYEKLCRALEEYLTGNRDITHIIGICEQLKK